MRVTWQGPGRARPQAPHIIRKARPTSGRHLDAATPDPQAMATTQGERRRIQRANRKAYRKQR
jgi:hypothetical protein